MVALLFQFVNLYIEGGAKPASRSSWPTACCLPGCTAQEVEVHPKWSSWAMGKALEEEVKVPSGCDHCCQHRLPHCGCCSDFITWAATLTPVVAVNAGLPLCLLQRLPYLSLCLSASFCSHFAPDAIASALCFCASVSGSTAFTPRPAWLGPY